MDDEEIHKHLFDAHWQLMAARASINAAMRLLGEKGEHHDPDFEALRGGVGKQRDGLDAVLSGLGNERTAVIRKTGCSGSCHKEARAA